MTQESNITRRQDFINLLNKYYDIHSHDRDVLGGVQEASICFIFNYSWHEILSFFAGLYRSLVKWFYKKFRRDGRPRAATKIGSLFKAITVIIILVLSFLVWSLFAWEFHWHLGDMYYITIFALTVLAPSFIFIIQCIIFRFSHKKIVGRKQLKNITKNIIKNDEYKKILECANTSCVKIYLQRKMDDVAQSDLESHCAQMDMYRCVLTCSFISSENEDWAVARLENLSGDSIGTGSIVRDLIDNITTAVMKSGEVSETGFEPGSSQKPMKFMLFYKSTEEKAKHYMDQLNKECNVIMSDKISGCSLGLHICILDAK